MRALLFVMAVALAACATSARPDETCALSSEDRAWIDASLHAWRFSAAEIISGAAAPSFEAVFFDDACVLTSPDAFSATDVAAVRWTAAPHTGEITLPTGETMPAGVVSFASADGARAFFVMSTPSIWRAAGVSNEALGLETMMTAVLLHEGSHVAQSSTYGALMLALTAANNLSDDFNDNTIQERFGSNAEFAASIERETDLRFQIAGNPNEAEARRLAREALDLMRARRARWFVGEDAYLAEAEDIWLTFEGTGQWLGYQWIVHPAGGGADSAAAMPHFARRGRSWSQKQGIALAFAVDRLARFDWKSRAYGNGAMTLTEMLESALAPH